MPKKAKYRARRLQIRKYLWVAGTLGTAAGAMGQGLSTPADESQNGTSVAKPVDSTIHQSAMAMDSKSGSQPNWKLSSYTLTSAGSGKGGATGAMAGYAYTSQWREDSPDIVPLAGATDSNVPSYAKLESADSNRSGAIRLLDQLFIGASLDPLRPNFGLTQYSPSLLSYLAGNTDDRFRIGGLGSSWDGTLGLTLKFSKHQRLSLNYRPPMGVDDNGHSVMAESSGASFGFGTPVSTFNPRIKLPTILGLDYGIDLTETISLAADIAWMKFSQYQSPDLGPRADSFGSATGGASFSASENSHNFASGLAGGWKFSDHWIFRAGYQFFASPVPNSTFAPNIPNANQHVITLGVGWKGKSTSLEAAYGMDFYADRHIGDQQPYNGTYALNTHLLSLAFNHSF